LHSIATEEEKDKNKAKNSTYTPHKNKTNNIDRIAQKAYRTHITALIYKNMRVNIKSLSFLVMIMLLQEK